MSSWWVQRFITMCFYLRLLGPKGEKVHRVHSLERSCFTIDGFLLVAGWPWFVGISGTKRVKMNFISLLSLQGEMGPKGERGHPGSIVWNGVKVNTVQQRSGEDLTTNRLFRERRANQAVIMSPIARDRGHLRQSSTFKVLPVHLVHREWKATLVLQAKLVWGKLDHLGKMYVDAFSFRWHPRLTIPSCVLSSRVYQAKRYVMSDVRSES